MVEVSPPFDHAEITALAAATSGARLAVPARRRRRAPSRGRWAASRRIVGRRCPIRRRRPTFIDRLPEAFRNWLAGRRIEEVECIVPDIAGISRGKAMPFAKFSREDRMFLPTSIFHQTISGDYVDMHDRQPVDRARHGAEARLRDRHRRALGRRRDAAGDPQRRGPVGRAGAGGAAQRAEAGHGALRGRGLGAGGGAGDGVLPDQAEPQPQRADRAADRAHRAADGQRARPIRCSAVDEYGKVIDDIYEFAEAQGFEIDTHHPGGRRRPGRDQPRCTATR